MSFVSDFEYRYTAWVPAIKPEVDLSGQIPYIGQAAQDCRQLIFISFHCVSYRGRYNYMKYWRHE